MAINDTIKDKILAWQIQNNEEAFVKAYDLYGIYMKVLIIPVKNL